MTEKPDGDTTSGQLDELLAALASTPTIRAAGDRVTERVLLDRQLDSGGMGELWVGRHETLGIEVAVKFIRSATSSHAMKRFAREARLAAKLRCPHSVRVFDHGVTTDGSPFIVMELLAGESLADRLRRDGSLAVREVKVLISQVAAAVEEAHQLAFVHRDIKPSNIFLSDTESTSRVPLFSRLLDFGLARGLSRHDDTWVTATGAIPGTPRYMALEQLLDGEDAKQSSDIWALAVVAYEALAGRAPFDGPTPAAIAARIREPLDLAPVPEPLHDWFRRALSVAPHERFPTVGTLAAAFADALDRPGEGAATDARANGGRPVGRSAIALAALVVVAAAAFFAARGKGSPQAEIQAAASSTPVTETPPQSGISQSGAPPAQPVAMPEMSGSREDTSASPQRPRRRDEVGPAPRAKSTSAPSAVQTTPEPTSIGSPSAAPAPPAPTPSEDRGLIKGVPF